MQTENNVAVDVRNQLAGEASACEQPLFVSWAPYCSRSDSMAKRLGGRSYMVYAPFWGSHPATILIKYTVQFFRTLRLLVRHRPGVVFVMAPPVIACIPVWIYSKIAGATFIIDAHTGAFLDRRWERLAFLQKFFSRRALTTIVTNEYLQKMVKGWGANATIVTDVPLCFPKPRDVTLDGAYKMTVVSSFCHDEPVEQILMAAAELPEITFYVTGDAKRLAPNVRQSTPENVHFTGFLSDAEYVGQLQASDAIVVLTTRDHTMQRGAYEAIYLKRPVVTSNFDILRRSFAKGAVHVDATVEDIVRGLKEMQGNLPRYTREADDLRQQKLAKWEQVSNHLRSLFPRQ